jgi:hypothetical protein
MTVHDFTRSLAASHAQADAPWWETVYRQAFPAFETMVNLRADGWAQRGGIDREIVLSDGTVLKVDEKVRSRDWADIALERWSDRDRRTPGWVQKGLTCDFIAYAFVPSGTCYLLPFQTLRRAWQTEGRAWIDKAEQGRDGFRVVLAQNNGYTTESVAVPIPVLLDAIRDSMVIRFDPGLPMTQPTIEGWYA